jgi:DNA mismatch repair ATPase MutS
MILEKVTDHSLVLMDESFSSTDMLEGSYMASEVLMGMSAIGCRGVFCTHMHGLMSEIKTINENSCNHAAIDTLVAGERTGGNKYIILRNIPDGKSHAKDIADKYGLSYNTIIEKRNNKNCI